MCKEIAEYLVEAYPGYPWHVRIDGGMLIIKNMKISEVWSMTRKFSVIAHDAKRTQIRSRDGRRRVPRGREHAPRQGDGENAKTLEGRLDKNPFKP
jgi:hypothetical protein